MIPKSIITSDIKIAEKPSKTWFIDTENGRVANFINNLQSVKQATQLILNTERFKYLIYSFNYGMELQGLIGMNPSYIKSELYRRIEEALLQDNRIKGIENFATEIDGDVIAATFTVISNFGNFEVSKEVRN